MTSSIKAWLLDQGLDPTLYYTEKREDDTFVIPKFAGKEQCPERGVIQCSREKGHGGFHSEQYWHLGGLGCCTMWED